MWIGTHINALLFNYDCVIIPGLGGFVANHTPARIQPEKQLAFPPSKGIIFNKNLISNDGLLAEQISRQEGISYPDAQEKINLFVRQSKEKLSRGERIIFEELGVLYLDKEQNIQFQPDFSVNFLTESFGLSPVVARELVRTEKETTSEQTEASVVSIVSEEEPTTEIAAIVRTSKMRRYWPAAAAVLIPIAFYSIWIPFATDYLKTGHLELADLNPFQKNTKIEFTDRKNHEFSFTTNTLENEWNSLIENTGGPVAKLPLGDNGNFLNVYVVPNNTVAETTYVDHKTYTGGYRHHIIAGCFREQSNAEQLVAELKSQNKDARILDFHNGLHRVSIGSYADKAEALSQLNSFRKDQPNVWLLEK